MLRGLIHHGRISALVAAGAAVAAAVLTGALLVGDSVRGSLRDLALNRLGRIDRAVVSLRFFREDLAGSLGGSGGMDDAAPAILLQGSATHAGTRARAAGVGILGVDGRFEELFPAPGGGRFELPFAEAGRGFPAVVLNRALAEELGAQPGDAVLLGLPRPGEAPRDSLLGRRDPEDVLDTLRCTVSGIIPDRAAGRFALTLHQTFPRNAYLGLADLQRALEERGRVNALLIPAGPGGSPEAGLDLRGALTLDDLGLKLVPGSGHVSVESRDFVLRPPVADAVLESAGAAGLAARPIQTYLVNEIRIGERSIPYSAVTAVDVIAGDAIVPLRLTGGGPPPRLEDGDILLNEWAAGDLGARVGDEVALTYYVVGPRDELTEETERFTLRGVVPFWGLAADPNLTPDFPGIGDADDMSDWEPPFPVDLDRVRPRDEQYWDDHRATPKAFVSAAAGSRMWASRYGTVTAVRVGSAADDGGDGRGDGIPERLEAALDGRLDPAWFGYQVLPLRRQGLRAAAGATDFSQLFLGFSMFLIASAALLTGLMFRLGVERRAGEVGLLRAVGFPERAVRRRFLAEGATLAAAGATAGAAAGLGYAALMMLALRTIWLPAVGTPLLFLHARPMSLAVGWLSTMLVVLLAVAVALRRLGRVPAATLLAGSLAAQDAARTGGRGARRLALAALGAGIGAAGFAWWSGQASSPGLAFGSGAALLVAGLAGFAAWCRRPRRGDGRATAPRGIGGMAVRNSAWVPGRSLLAVALVGSAAFVIVLVASQRHGAGEDAGALDSGTGGYDLVAETDIPVHQDLNREEGRIDLGFSRAESAALAASRVVPFRVLPGEDASCLNLFRPERPRVLGVPPEQILRGGFTFGRTLDPAADGAPTPAAGDASAGGRGATAGGSGGGAASGGGIAPDPRWSLLTRDLGPGVIPAFADAHSATWILKLGLGDDLVLEDEYGREVRLRLVGLLQGSLFQSELLISEESFLRHFPGRSGYGFFLIDAPDGEAEAVSLALESRLASFGLDAARTQERLAGFLAVETTYLSTFQTLGGLGLLLGTLGLGIVLARNVLERRGELATLRAIGFRARGLAWMVLAENGFLLLLGVALGSLSALLAVTPRLLESGQALPWTSLSVTLASVLAAGLLSSVVAVRTSLRTPLLPTLKSDR